MMSRDVAKVKWTEEMLEMKWRFACAEGIGVSGGSSLAYLGRFACSKRESIASRRELDLISCSQAKKFHGINRKRTDLDSALPACQTTCLGATLDFLEKENVSTSPKVSSDQRPSPSLTFLCRPPLMRRGSC